MLTTNNMILLFKRNEFLFKHNNNIAWFRQKTFTYSIVTKTVLRFPCNLYILQTLYAKCVQEQTEYNMYVCKYNYLTRLPPLSTETNLFTEKRARFYCREKYSRHADADAWSSFDTQEYEVIKRFRNKQQQAFRITNAPAKHADDYSVERNASKCSELFLSRFVCLYACVCKSEQIFLSLIHI